MIISFQVAVDKRDAARVLEATQFRAQLGVFLTQRGFESFFDFDPTDYADQVVLVAAHIVGSAIFSYEILCAHHNLTTENFAIMAEATCVLADQLAKLAALPTWQSAAEEAISQIFSARLDSETILAIRDAAILVHRERSHGLLPKRIEELSQSVLRTIEDRTDNALTHIAGLLISSLKAVA